MAIVPYVVDLERPQAANANVADLYKNSTLEEVRADLDKRRLPLVNICMNLTSDFNKGSVIRANNVFLGRAVYLVGKRKYNRVGAVGTHLYEHVFQSETLEEVLDFLRNEGYTIFGVDNQPEYNPVNIWDAELPLRSAFLYGEEQAGLSLEALALCDQVVYIHQEGSVRSLNVAQAAACVMSEYSRRHRLGRSSL